MADPFSTVSPPNDVFHAHLVHHISTNYIGGTRGLAVAGEVSLSLIFEW